MHSPNNPQNFSEEEEKGDVPSEMDPVVYDSNRKTRYDKLGSAGIEGSLYQINLLTLVLLNGLRKVKNWRLSTEDKAAPQFDDLIFVSLPSESAILLQAKHKMDESIEISSKDLMSVDKKSEFGLPKYFFSYQNVKNTFRVQNVVIATNLKLAETIKSILKEESVDPGSVLHFEGAENICYGFRGCTLPKLKQNIERYHVNNINKEDVHISDEDINDFLNHLKFFPNCLGDKIVENAVEQTISLIKFSENLNIKTVQLYIRKKMEDWFQEVRGRYLTEMEAKAFFCDIRSNKYRDNLTSKCNISFKNNNLPLILQTQQANQNERPKQISHIILDKEHMLNVVKICQALPIRHKDTTLFVSPEEGFQVQKEIIDAFAVQHYTILVMVCPNAIEETIAKEMCDKVTKILNTYKYKHVIVIAEEKDNLATQLKEGNIDCYEAITDSVKFADLEETTKEEFKSKRLINFQGSIMSLEELFMSSTEDDLNKIVNSELLIELARGDKSKVGQELPHPDSYYISRSFNRKAQHLSEEELWRRSSEEKVILISDSAGMGKSCVLTSLAVSIKRANPHLWVVRIDLSNYTKIMKETLARGRKSVSIVELLESQETSKIKSEFGRKLLSTPRRIVLLLDGADEISPTYTDLVLNLIRDSLLQVNLVKIIVTTRPHMSKDFTKIPELQTFTPTPFSKDRQEQMPELKFFALEPFSKLNQIHFLTEYWMQSLGLQGDVRISKCKIFAKALIREISRWLNEGNRNDFAGIPLQTRMLAEVFQEKNQISDEEQEWDGCKEFSSSNNEEPKFPTRIALTQLYEMFINKKRHIFIKNRNPSGVASVDELFEEQFEKCQEYHQALALKEIFDSDKWGLFTFYTNVEWPIPSKIGEDLFRVGIVQKQGENIEFLHRTFAEFFVADCLLKVLKCQPVNEEFQQFFMEPILSEEEYYVIRAFLDGRMRNELHLNVIENNFCSYFNRNPISEESLTTYFEVYGKEGCAEIFKCFIKCIDKEQRELLSNAVNEPYLMYETLKSAIGFGHLNILQLLLELNETVNKGKDAHKQFLAFLVIYSVTSNFRIFQFLSRKVEESNTNISTPELHGVVFVGVFGKVELWMEKADADRNTEDNIRGSMAHRGAVSMSRLQVVKFVMEAIGADINGKDSNGETALGYAVSCGELEIIKYLMEEGANINVKNNEGKTVLFQASFGGKLEIVKYLLERAGAHINVKDWYGRTALHVAASNGKLEIFKYLVEDAGADINCTNNIGSTALHLAASNGELEIFKYLVEESGADINVKVNDGLTALHLVASNGKLEIFKYLVEEAGADINVKENNGLTALHLAVFNCKLEIFKYLVEESGADINVKNNDGWTALHLAAFNGELEIFKYLVEEAGADINVKDNEGWTALHEAAWNSELEIIKYLVEEARADKNVKDNDGSTALHLAAFNGKLEIIKYLVEEARADKNVKLNDGSTALHVAAWNSELEIIKYLVEEARADINVKDNEGWTALHEAAWNSELEIIKYLVEEARADKNVKDNDGSTALHLAASNGKLEIFKYLVEESGADINVKINDGWTALHLAASNGELEIFKYLVEESGADINVKINDGWTALHLAASNGELEIFKYLVEEAGADINVKENNGLTALHLAAFNGKLEIFKYLVEESGADINVKNNDGWTALHLAASNGKLEIFKYLVEESGADINVKNNNNGWTALHLAASNGELEIFKYLVEESGADINVKNNDGWTALHLAASNGELEIFKYLVEESGADINVKNNNNGWTALHLAASNGELEIFKYLVEESGADINVKNNDGWTALHLAASNGELEIFKYLVEESGADINVKNNNNGWTALHLAASNGELEIFKYLVEESGADINVKNNNNGWTALHLAASNGELEIFKYLVEESGADINVKNNDGWTALHLAASNGELEIFKYLVEESGADINVKLNDGSTALHVAAWNSELEIIKYLVEEARADINVKDNDGWTALHLAASNGKLEIFKYLVEDAGADINCKNNNNGWTALHVAAWNGKLEIFKYLVEESGADINVKLNDGSTALHVAAWNSELEIIKYLVEEARADINVKDNDGSTALHLAAFNGKLEIVKCLVEEAGADKDIKDNQGRTAIRLAADRGHRELVEYLSN